MRLNPDKAVRVEAPATIGNVAAGFDLLGLAIEPVDGRFWGDVVTARAARVDGFESVGPFSRQLPADPGRNLCVVALDLARNLLGRRSQAVHLHLNKGLPVGSGLGSSSASAVAAAVAALELLDPGGDRRERLAQVLEVAGKTEAAATGAGHLDNVAPCLAGGLQLLTPLGPRPLFWPSDLAVVVASPACQLETRAARAVLPAALALGDAVAFAGNLGSLLLALSSSDRPLLAASLRDLVAEPHRAALVPGFREAQQGALQAGALGCSLSGAGPAVFAVCELGVAPAIARALEAGFASAGLESEARICRVSARGAIDRVTRAPLETP